MKRLLTIGLFVLDIEVGLKVLKTESDGASL